MTPEEAQEIDYQARIIEHRKHQDAYTPVNQQLVILAGYRAVIDAVRAEMTIEFANQYLDKQVSR